MKFKSVNIGEFTFSVVGDGDSEFQFTVTGTLDKGGYSKVDGTEFLKDLEDYISRFGEDELLNLKRRIISALGVSLSDRMIRLEDASELHDFSYPITLIAHQTKSHENVCKLLDRANKKCTELETLKEDICKTMAIPSNTADINVVREVSGLKRKLMDAKEDLDKLNGKYYDLQHRYDIIHDAFVERNTFRDEVYKILNVNRETWSDPDIYSTLKIQQERADLYTRRENLEEKVPSMIKELYDLIRTSYSDKLLEKDTEDPCYMGIVTQQMFDYLKERIESFKENEGALLERISKIRKASSEAIETLREELY